MTGKIKVNQLTIEDISKVLNLQRNCYSKEYLEDYETFLRMKTVYPRGCWGIKNDGVLEGYIFFHPFYEEIIKPLDHNLVLNGSENCMYLHDIAVNPLYRGLNHSKKLLEQFNKETTRQGFSTQCLVAVQNSHDFWIRYGFKVVRKIENYGKGPAFYMRKCTLSR